jgi:hypothetical protein
MKNTRRYLWLSAVSLALAVQGCNSLGSRSDSQIAVDVQSKVLADATVPDKQITIAANQGVVTLSGTVSSDAARTAAASDAGQVNGVKTVVNNLQVAPTAAANVAPPQAVNPVQAESPAPVPAPQENSRPTRTRTRRSGSENGGLNSRNNPATTATSPANTMAQNAPPPAPIQVAPIVPTPTPVQKVTIPVGTQLSVRISEELSSATAQVGDTFHGSISAPVSIDDQTVIPTTADVEGRVVDSKAAGKFAGGSALTLQLTKLVMNGKSYSIQTDQWSKNAAGRGKGTAEKVGGGAAVGAILGGILGGGKGAAIGTVVGGGAGTAGAAVGKGQQIDLKPESVINFTLQSPLTVTPSAARQPMQP